MWTEENLPVIEELDDDWRAGAVLQGAGAYREPDFRTLRQRWTTERRNVVLTVEASAVHERLVGVRQEFTEELTAAAELSRGARQETAKARTLSAPAVRRTSGRTTPVRRRGARPRPGRADVSNKMAATP